VRMEGGTKRGPLLTPGWLAESGGCVTDARCCSDAAVMQGPLASSRNKSDCAGREQSKGTKRSLCTCMRRDSTDALRRQEDPVSNKGEETRKPRQYI